VFQQAAFGPGAGSALQLLELSSPWPALLPFLGKFVICAENGEYGEDSLDSRQSSGVNCHAYQSSFFFFFSFLFLDSAGTN